MHLTEKAFRLKPGHGCFFMSLKDGNDMASFENFEPIFGEPKPEIANTGSDLLRRCLYHVYASDSHHLTVRVTDFVSSSWETVLSVSQLDDMGDTVGIGGSLSEFIDYMVASLKSENVKLILDGLNGFGTAQLVSQKVKGLPRVTIWLKKIAGSSASEAMANLSLELFKSFRNLQHLHEGARSSVVSSEKEKKETKNNQHFKRETMEKMSSSDRPDFSALLMGNGEDSSAKQAAWDASVTKATKRAPAHRRARKRGARLQDSEDEEG